MNWEMACAGLSAIERGGPSVEVDGVEYDSRRVGRGDVFVAMHDDATAGTGFVAVAAREAVMEMSSHALEEERGWGLPVDVGIFTNLTQDHVDYHGTMERYFAAKVRLFEGVGAPPPRVAVINGDDAYGARLAVDV